MTFRNLCLFIVGIFWLAWLGLLTCANWVVCEEWLPESWSAWLLQRARYAHTQCQSCCEEINS